MSSLSCSFPSSTITQFSPLPDLQVLSRSDITHGSTVQIPSSIVENGRTRPSEHQMHDDDEILTSDSNIGNSAVSEEIYSDHLVSGSTMLPQ